MQWKGRRTFFQSLWTFTAVYIMFFCNGENLTFKRQQIIHGEITIYTFYTNIEIFVVKSKSH